MLRGIEFYIPLSWFSSVPTGSRRQQTYQRGFHQLPINQSGTTKRVAMLVSKVVAMRILCPHCRNPIQVVKLHSSSRGAPHTERAAWKRFE
jgi:hypothetical protein